MKYSTVLLVVFAILAIILLLRHIRPIKENFEEERKSKNILYSIIPSLQDEWIGASLSNNDNISMTTSLSYGFWNQPLGNSKTKDDFVIMHLSYDKDMSLLGCGSKLVGSDLQWKLFKKENKNPVSEWKEVPSNIPVVCTLFDSDGILMGIHANNGQIYKKESTDLNSKFKGPIQFDKPMSKILFDKDGILIGIGRENNYIYKKDSYFWRESKWNQSPIMINKEPVYDLVHDYDGCLIACTESGLKKQKNPSFLQPFYTLNEKHVVNDKEPLSLYEIIQARCGFIPSSENAETEDITHLNDEYKKILEFKKQQKVKCNKRSNLLKNFIYSSDIQTLNPLFHSLEEQSKTIDSLEGEIQILQNKLNL